MKWLIALLSVVVLLGASCDLAKDTADETQQSGEGAVGIAEQMSGGTVGDADLDTGESAAGGDDGDVQVEEDTQ